jgi:transposase
MARHTDGEHEDAKTQALRQSGSLHAHPEKVIDPLFRDSEFFDPRDLVLVKYEMLRRVQVEELPVAQAARAFGFTRPVFYHALAAVEAEGLPGLIPQRPGPKEAHKLSAQVLDYLDELLAQDPALRSEALARQVLKKFKLSVHSRSIERALARRKKGRHT